IYYLITYLTAFLFFFLTLPPPPTSTLFPYTTLFRSRGLSLCPHCRWPADRELGPAGCCWSDRPIRGPRCLAQRQRGRACREPTRDRKSTRLNSSHRTISYAVFCLKKKTNQIICS